MEDNERKLDHLTVAQRTLLDEYERRLKTAGEDILKAAPEHVKELGGIVRNNLANGSLVELKAFLHLHDIEIDDCDLEAFRDHLIIQRIDLKDLEPAARERIFLRAHARENSENATKDFLAEKRLSGKVRCRSCRWFVTAPFNGSKNENKSCVELGTKGADHACYGFTYPNK